MFMGYEWGDKSAPQSVADAYKEVVGGDWFNLAERVESRARASNFTEQQLMGFDPKLVAYDGGTRKYHYRADVSLMDIELAVRLGHRLHGYIGFDVATTGYKSSVMTFETREPFDRHSITREPTSCEIAAMNASKAAKELAEAAACASMEAAVAENFATDARKAAEEALSIARTAAKTARGEA